MHKFTRGTIIFAQKSHAKYNQTKKPPMKQIKFAFTLLSDSFNEFMNDNGLKLSAALSYYTVFSLAPMLLVIISVLSIFFGRDAIQGELFDQIRGLVGDNAAAQLQEILKNAQVSNK